MITRAGILPVVPALLLAALAGLAQAAPAVEVGVAGRIKPLSPICTVNVPEQLEYGVIPINTINVDRITMLDKKRFKVNVHCNEATKFTVQFVDAKRDTVVDDALFLAEVAQTRPVSPDEGFGLGLDGAGRKIGAMFMHIDSARYGASGLGYPGVPVYQKGPDWVRANEGRLHQQVRYTLLGWSELVPALMSNATLNVQLVPVLDSAHLDLTKEIELGGELTLEISQL